MNSFGMYFILKGEVEKINGSLSKYENNLKISLFKEDNSFGFETFFS